MSDTPVPEDLRRLQDTYMPHGLIHRVCCFASLGSTNQTLRDWARRGEPEGTVVIADRQVRGRGRMGRDWHSPAGCNLYLSILVRPRLKPDRASLLTLLAAAAVAETLDRSLGLQPQIKWPNDILLDGKKCCGILIEMESSREVIDHAVVGIGLNANMKDSLPEVSYPVTSLSRELGRDLDRSQVATDLLKTFELRYRAACDEDFVQVLEWWRGYEVLSGREVRMMVGERDVTGVVRGYDALGGIRLQSGGGAVQTVHSGEVTRVRPVSALREI